ncbi:MAG: trans-sulfuration enzyme family protein [Planctomycetota bacterium]
MPIPNDYNPPHDAWRAVRPPWIHEPKENKGMCLPIDLSVNHTFGSLRFLQDHVAGIEEGHLYHREGNPTVNAVEKILAGLEGAVSGLLFSSGMGAELGVILPYLEPGDHVLTTLDVYGHLYRWLKWFGPKQQVTATFVPAAAGTDAFLAAIQPNTRLVFLESPTNPLCRCLDIARIAEVCRERTKQKLPRGPGNLGPIEAGVALAGGTLFVVDNTFATPYNQRPLDLGAHIVMHSVTKYLAGHNDVLAGCLCGDWKYIFPSWNVRQIYGAMISSFDSYTIARGLKTFPLRMERHNQNALALARWLEKDPRVSDVWYPGLESAPDHAVAKKQMTGGFGGMLSFRCKGGPAAAERIFNTVQVAIHAPSLGCTETLICPPADTSQKALSEADREKIGVDGAVIRVSVGIEPIDMLTADFDQALKPA